MCSTDLSSAHMNSTLPFASNRPIDIACLGRLAVDLYADQVGCSLESANSFSKYLGGSSGNIAFGTARLGMRSAMISRVGDEQNGRFLLDVLRQEGCDVTQVQIDPARLTGMVLLGLKDQHTFPLLFARENCADMALDANAMDDAFLSGCRSLLITGTHLSAPDVLAASRRALDVAGQHGVIRVLDIDYRPVLWGLTSRGDGETRYISSSSVSQKLQIELPSFELIIGTEEEWMIAGGVEDDIMGSLRRAREITKAVFVVKRGPLGCTVIDGAIPSHLDDALTVLGEQVEVLNVLGAGDAFASGLLTGLLSGKGWRDSAVIANACGAIVVSRHGCAPAMPTPAELAHWFSGNRHTKPDQDSMLSHLHRVSAHRPKWPELYVLAYDHRSQFEAMAIECGVDISRISKLKVLINEVVKTIEQEDDCRGKVGVLIDGRLGEAALHDATGRGWWVGRPIELPGSRPLRFDQMNSLGSHLRSWPREQVVKCLVFYHPNDPLALREEQDRQLQIVWEATRLSGHELLLEVIPPPDRLASDDQGESSVAVVQHLYDIGLKPEWWKLGVMSSEQWDALDALVQERDPWCRGAVILGLNQPMDQLLKGFAQARSSIVKGFMIGRSVWAEPSLAWFKGEVDDSEFCKRVASNFRSLIAGWRSTRACFAGPKGGN